MKSTSQIAVEGSSTAVETGKVWSNATNRATTHSCPTVDMKHVDKEEVRKLRVLNSLSKDDFIKLSEEAISQDGEGSMVSKMFHIYEKRQIVPPACGDPLAVVCNRVSQPIKTENLSVKRDGKKFLNLSNTMKRFVSVI